MSCFRFQRMTQHFLDTSTPKQQRSGSHWLMCRTTHRFAGINRESEDICGSCRTNFCTKEGDKPQYCYMYVNPITSRRFVFFQGDLATGSVCGSLLDVPHTTTRQHKYFPFCRNISVRSPRKLFIFIIYNNLFWMKVTKNILFNFEKGGTRKHCQAAILFLSGKHAFVGHVVYTIRVI